MYRHCPSHCAVRTLAGIPEETCLPRNTSPLQHKCVLLPSTSHPRHPHHQREATFLPSSFCSSSNKSIFKFKLRSSTPGLSRSHIPWAVKQQLIIWRMLALVASSPPCCLFLVFLSFSGMSITPDHLPVNPQDPSGQSSQWHTLAEVLTQPPPVLENKRAFKLEYDPNPTFTCCWLNPAFSTDFLGQSVIYSLHTRKLNEWEKGHYFAFFFLLHDMVCCFPS